MNLLDETIHDLKIADQNPEDIIFIGSEESGYSCSWDEFKILANKEYDAGFGAQEVAMDLIIVFEDGSKMWRSEYDGSECWEYSTSFKEPSEFKKINRLFVPEDRVGWCNLKEINED